MKLAPQNRQQRTREPYNRLRPDLAELRDFHFYDVSEGLNYRSPLAVGRDMRPAYEKMVGTQCAFIGDEARPSILTQNLLRLLLRKT